MAKYHSSIYVVIANKIIGESWYLPTSIQEFVKTVQHKYCDGSNMLLN